MGSFPPQNPFGFKITRCFFILRGNLDKAVHLLIWHHDIFLSRAFLPHYELQEIMVFLEIRDLFPGSMHEHEIRMTGTSLLDFIP